MKSRKVVAPAIPKPKAPPVRPLVIIENSTLAGLARNPAAVKEFPFLSAITQATKKESCSSCERNDAVAKAYAKAKKSVAGLDSGRKALLLRLLNAKAGRVTYKTGENVARDINF